MPFYVVKFRSVKYVLLVIIAAIILSVSIDGVSAAQVYFGYPNRKVPIYSVETQEKQVAISFDAAWGADKTADIMKVLKEFESGATFFLVGFWVDKYNDMTKSISENGFEIGTHSNTHPDMTKLSKDQIKQELESSINLIKTASGRESVDLFRPPYGAYNNDLIDVAESLNLKTVQWDVDSLDWKGLSAEDITQRILSQVKNGSIILCHNNSDHIVEALPLILDRLKKQGYKITSVGDLVIKDNYVIDRNGLQKSTGQTSDKKEEQKETTN